MQVQGNENDSDYISRAIQSFHNIMSSNRGKTLESLNRFKKGELFVLNYLSVHNAEALPSELSEALGSTTGRMSSLLGVLEKKGYVERNIDKKNRRNTLVTITAAGREREHAEMKELYHLLYNIFERMGEADSAEFLRLTEKFFSITEEEII